MVIETGVMRRFVKWWMMRKVLLITILIVGLICIIGSISGWVYLRSSLPQTQGTVVISGLNDQIEIMRDAAGVPHIYASTDQNAFFALGYVHAQDRLWQMELLRHVGAGRLSEIFGDPTVDTDKFLRTLGLYRSAKATWTNLNVEVQADLEAYTKGINAWIHEGHTLPPEFLLLGTEIEQWSVYDSVVVAKIMALDLSGSWDQELLHMRLMQAVGAERAAQLLPAYPKNSVSVLAADFVPVSTLDKLLRRHAQLQHQFQIGGPYVGSNSWVIAGSHTRSGLPILANDPHLGSQIPSTWYLVELESKTLHIIGASLPGLPYVVIGHNEHVAWGVTNLTADVQDLYIERINSNNFNQYEVEGQWVDMDIVEESIIIKGKEKPLQWAARSTRHGPLISDVVDGMVIPLALRWTALDSDDKSIDAFRGINFATNWDSFKSALQNYVAPSMNFLYADVMGNIGYLAAGRIPIRSQDDTGMMPFPVESSQHEWKGWIPFAELPQGFNPQNGFIVTANNRVTSDDYPYIISNDWAPPYRAERITRLIQQMIGDGHRISIDDMIMIQADQQSGQAQELLPLLLKVEPRNERESEALLYLKNWDGNLGIDSTAAAIYEAWLVHLQQAIVEDDLQGDLYSRFVDQDHAIFLANTMAQIDSPWCDNVLTTPVESCTDAAQEGLDRALDDLEEHMGGNIARWQWGRIHHTYYPHHAFNEVFVLNRIFGRQIANGGDSQTVNVASVDLSQPYRQVAVPSYRQIVDMSNLNNSLYIITTGQSGNILSKHYDDLINRHQNVQYLKMNFERTHILGESLFLLPK